MTNLSRINGYVLYLFLIILSSIPLTSVANGSMNQPIFSDSNCITTVEITLGVEATVSAAMEGTYEVAEDCIPQEGGGWTGGVDYQVCFRKTDGSNWRIWNTGCGWEIGYATEDVDNPGDYDWVREARSYTGQCTAIPPLGLTIQALNTSTFYNGFGNPLLGITSTLTECTGCTDPIACNYDISAMVDDGSCAFGSDCLGDDCITTIEITLGTEATVSAAMAGTYEVAEDCIPQEGGGWTGGVDYQVCFRKTDGSNWRIWNTGCGWEIGYATEDVDNPGDYDWAREARSYSGQCTAIPPLGLTIQALNTSTFYNGFGNPLIGIISTLTDCMGCTDSDACNYDISALEDDGSCTYAGGCLDVGAINFNSLADCDNGTCIYVGCTNENDVNYNANASYDDGSCELYGSFCPGDFDGNGSLSAFDLAAFLGVFGTVCE